MSRALPLVAFALIAFAANSILSRYALGAHNIDPISFTTIRLLSGAVALGLLLFVRSRTSLSIQSVFTITKSSIMGASYLLLYAVTFSFAYITLNTATGALLLFGTVQLCMMSIGFIKGQRLSQRECLGFALACIGFLLLTLPYVQTPSLSGLVLMTLSGVAWALYTLAGKNSDKPLNDTATNFIIASVLLIPLSTALFFLLDTELILSDKGILAAIASGALASGLGYAIWYMALPLLSTAQAASSQLLVPVIAAVGGLLLLQEPLSLLIIVSGLVMLSGIYLMVQR